MYELWRDRHIVLPSEYWNASTGDKIVLKAFHDKDIEEKNKLRQQYGKENAPIFPVIAV
jgi:hypothetical protein